MGKTVIIGWKSSDRTEEIDVSAIPLYTGEKRGVVIIDEDGEPTGALDKDTGAKAGKDTEDKDGSK